MPDDARYLVVTTVGYPARPEGWCVVATYGNARRRVLGAGSHERAAPDITARTVADMASEYSQHGQGCALVAFVARGTGAAMVESYRQHGRATLGTVPREVFEPAAPHGPRDRHTPVRPNITAALALALEDPTVDALDESTRAALRTYTGRIVHPAPGQDVADVHDGDPDGICVPVGVALLMSDPARHVGLATPVGMPISGHGFTGPTAPSDVDPPAVQAAKRARLSRRWP